jgi:hypothetical protein
MLCSPAYRNHYTLLLVDVSHYFVHKQVFELVTFLGYTWQQILSTCFLISSFILCLAAYLSLMNTTVLHYIVFESLYTITGATGS